MRVHRCCGLLQCQFNQGLDHGGLNPIFQVKQHHIGDAHHDPVALVVPAEGQVVALEHISGLIQAAPVPGAPSRVLCSFSLPVGGPLFSSCKKSQRSPVLPHITRF